MPCFSGNPESHKCGDGDDQGKEKAFRGNRRELLAASLSGDLSPSRTTLPVGYGVGAVAPDASGS